MKQLPKQLLRITVIIPIAVILFSLLSPISYSQTLLTKTYPLSLLSRNIKISAWSWENPIEMQTNLTYKLDKAQKEGISTIYVYIDNYIDIYELPESTEKQTKLTTHNEALKAIVRGATKRNILVYAVSGYTKWSSEDLNYIPPIMLKHIYQFNKTNYPLKIEGIQFDIEFYNDSSFMSDPMNNTLNFIKLVSNLTSLSKSLNASNGQTVVLEIALPHWSDKDGTKIPLVTWNGHKKPLTYHVIDILDSLPASGIAIMSYRQTAEKTIEVITNELSYAKGKNIRIFAGVEIEGTDETGVSLYGKTKNEIINHIYDVSAGVVHSTNFRGVTIHTLDAFLKL